jgi:organic radical activating enzyme
LVEKQCLLELQITPTTAIITTCSSNKHCFSTNDASFALNRWTKYFLMSAEEIYNKLREVGGDNFNHVTISGGNPALIKGIQDLVDLFEEHHIFTQFVIDFFCRH